MIPALCGFADLVRRHGGDVGSAELIDAARALALTDLADRAAVRRAIELTFAWSSVHPAAFDRLFDEWFSGRELEAIVAAGLPGDEAGDRPAVALDAESIEAARIHTDEAMTIEADDTAAEDGPEGATGDERSETSAAASSRPAPDDGPSVDATGELAAAPPRDDADGVAPSAEVVLVELPEAPPDAELELARRSLAEAIERRRRVEVAVTPRRVQAVSDPLSADERARLRRHVRRLDRQLDGAPSWRRARQPNGVIDVRRTMRRTVTTGGLPVDLRHLGRRNSAPLLVVLVDLSMSVRGTARLVLHLVHQLRTMRGSLRAFGFVDSCVPIDRAVAVADPAQAIERVLALVDVAAASDPGLALRQWWARSHHLVTADTNVLVLSDGRCNGRDPAFDVVERVSRRSASTLWVSPEPEGAWTLGRGEMAEYASRVDRAVTVRAIDDLDRLVVGRRPVPGSTELAGNDRVEPDRVEFAGRRRRLVPSRAERHVDRPRHKP
ncbi:MAG: VWA domain-containing protein [Actinomycetota bacterium]